MYTAEYYQNILDITLERLDEINGYLIFNPGNTQLISVKNDYLKIIGDIIATAREHMYSITIS